MYMFTIRVAAACAMYFIAQAPLSAEVVSFPRNLKLQLQRIQFESPSLAPMAHTRFCMQYPGDCRPRRMSFRKPYVALTSEKWNDLRIVNAWVNQIILPARNNVGINGENWLIGPSSGDCNDYAVTKRHQLLQRGWSSQALLLAEVMVRSGGHHVVLVVRTREGDFVLDNLSTTIQPWLNTGYKWMRIQTPRNPKYWATLVHHSG